MNLNIPGVGEFAIEHIVFDLNGTLAVDGAIPPSVRLKLRDLAQQCGLYVVTANTHGNLHDLIRDLPIEGTIIQGDEALEKQKVIHRLDARRTIAVGNGANDALMLKDAAIGIAIMGPEGCHPRALMNADLVVGSADDALDCLLKPGRLIASLRT